MKKAISLFCLLTIISLSSLYANNNLQKIYDLPGTNLDKQTIAIWPFSGDNNFGAISDLHNMVTAAVEQTGRFNVVERSRMDAILKEFDQSMGYESANSDVLLKQGEVLNASYYLFGNVNSVSTKYGTRKNILTGKNESYYSCSISLSLRIVEVETGQIKETETIIVGEDLLQLISAGNQQEAYTKGCKKVISKTEDFIKKAWPLTVTLVQIEDIKKGKATKVLVAGGSAMGLNKNDKLNVYEVTKINVGGEMKDREKLIATLSVSDVEGEELSICKVNKGGDLLIEKMEDTSAVLICKTN